MCTFKGNKFKVVGRGLTAGVGGWRVGGVVVVVAGGGGT